LGASKDFVLNISDYILKNVPNFDGYFATECGRVISTLRNTPVFINGKVDKDGYRNLILYKEGNRHYFKNSRVIAMTFLGERPKGYVIRHLDGNPLNDDVDNLQYSTQKENLQDRLLHGTQIYGELSPNAKLKEIDVIKLIALLKTNTVDSLCKEYGIKRSTLYDIKHNKTWKHLTR
jgi:hypothetical protein